MTDPSAPSDADLIAIRERVEAATTGPWEIRGVEVVRDSGGLPIIQALWVADIDPESGDAEFIAHAREDIPALLARLAEVERQRDRAEQCIEQVRAIRSHTMEWLRVERLDEPLDAYDATRETPAPAPHDNETETDV